MFLSRYILNICIYLPIILGLFVVVTKLSANQYSKVNRKKYVQVLEKTMISKDVYSLVIKMGDNTYAGILSPTGFSTVKELSRQEVMVIESSLQANTLELNNTLENLTKSFDTTKPYIQATIEKIKGFINKMSKEKK